VSAVQIRPEPPCVPPEAYASLGIRKSMTLDEVKARVAQINKEKRLEKKKVVAAVGNLKEMEIIESVYLPKDRAEGFRDWLIENHGIKGRSRKKILSHWRCVQRLIKATQLLPEQYHSNKKKILNHLIKQNYSLDYSKKVLRILNQYGAFVSEDQGRFYRPIGKLTPTEANRIRDGCFESKTYQGPSDALTPRQLESQKDKLKPAQYRWLVLAVWFGLRPKEVDALNANDNKKLFDIVTKVINGKPIQVLCIYQSKLTAVKREDRWKYIPAFHDSQIEALKLVGEGLQRPLNKTLKKLFGGQTTCYSGRKGFTDLMQSNGQKLEDISLWLGHRSIEMTWKHYKDKKAIQFTETPVRSA
jgi:integrase